jgi:transcriptional regulator with XRE-family HTH domain
MDGAAIGQRVKQLREARGWSQRQLENRAGISHGYISYLEAGERQPKMVTLEKIAGAFSVPVAQLTVNEDASTERDPRIEEIHVNLLALRELDEEELSRVAVVVEAMVERLKRIHREEEDAERRRRATE